MTPNAPSQQILTAASIPEKVGPQVSGKGAILTLISEDDPRLRQPSEPFVFEGKTADEIEQLYFDMVDTMRYNKGIGLSAVQVGLPIRLFVIETGGDHPEALFNPRVVTTEGAITQEEGCLSFPDIWVKVKRPDFVRIRYQLVNSETVTKVFKGFTARVILHEYDHLEGIIMKDRANKIHWEAALKKRKAYRKQRRGV